MAVVIVIALISGSDGRQRGTAEAAEPPTRTYTGSFTVPSPPASAYAGSAGGDGWALAMTPAAVYNVFHHRSSLQVACHLQTDALACWAPKTITDGGGGQFAVSGQPALLDRPADRAACTSTPPAAPTSRAAWSASTPPSPRQPEPVLRVHGAHARRGRHRSPAGSATRARDRQRWYAFNYANGNGVTGGRNKLMCFDLSDGRGVCRPAVHRRPRRVRSR